MGWLTLGALEFELVPEVSGAGNQVERISEALGIGKPEQTPGRKGTRERGSRKEVSWGEGNRIEVPERRVRKKEGP